MPEILVSLALGTIVGGAVLAMYLSQQRNFVVGSTYINLHQDARTAIDWFAKDARWAIEVAPSQGPYSTSDNSVVFKVPSIDAQGDVIDINNDFDYIIYRLNPSDTSKLERIVDGKNGVSSRLDEVRTVAENVDTLWFGYEGNGLGSVGDLSTVTYVDMSMVTSDTVLAMKLSNSLNTRIALRNN